MRWNLVVVVALVSCVTQTLAQALTWLGHKHRDQQQGDQQQGPVIANRGITKALPLTWISLTLNPHFSFSNFTLSIKFEIFWQLGYREMRSCSWQANGNFDKSVTDAATTSTSVTRKNRQMSIKVGQKWFLKINDRFWHLYKTYPIWTN